MFFNTIKSISHVLILWLVFLGTSLRPGLANASVESYTTTIVNVLRPEEPGDNWIFLLSAGGRALRLEDHDRAPIERLLKAVGQTQLIRIDATNMGDFDRIEDIQELSEPQARPLDSTFPIEPLPSRPSSVAHSLDYDFAGHSLTPQGIFNFFKSMRLRRSSQCFHRAYYWAHQLWRNTGALSHKVFLFFTWKYIRHYNYYWWFHVAPYVYDENGDEVVLDPTFLSKGVTMKRWTDNFLRNDPECPTVSDYKGHGEHERDQWCYLVKSRMHYYHPNVIEASNKTARPVTGWDEDYLSIARRSR